MKIGGIVQHQQRLRTSRAGLRNFFCRGLFLRSFAGCLHRLQVCGQVNAALLADFFVVALDVGNQLTEVLLMVSRLARSSFSSLSWLQPAI